MGTENQTQQTKKTIPPQQSVQPAGPDLEPWVAPAAAALQGALAAPPPAIRPEDILALQRTAGNRAVQRLLADRASSRPGASNPSLPGPAGDITGLPEHSVAQQVGQPLALDAPIAQPVIQRDGADPGASGSGKTLATGLDAGMFDVSGAELKYGGNVTINSSAERIQLIAPTASFEATVKLHDDLELGQDKYIEVGPVQTLLDSERTGIYRRGGLPDGDIIAQKHVTTGEVRDAQFDPKNPTQATFPAPWYSRPTSITDGSPQATVNFLDQPDFTMPRKMGQGKEQGKLTETQGEDRFVLSLSAKREGTLVHLQSTNWEVPWNVDDPQNKTEGGEVFSAPATDVVHTSEGPIAAAANQEWTAFRSVEAAMGASAAELIQSLPMASVYDQEAWGYMVEALRRKNPIFSVTIKVEETAETFSPDDIQVTATGHKTAQQGPISINDKESGTFTFGLNELFDPAGIGPDTIIEFQVQDVGWVSNEPATGSWSYPFNTRTEGKLLSGGGGGKYFMTYSLQ